MSDHHLSLFTSRSLASESCAQRLYDALRAWAYTPDVFDEYEPVRKPWSRREDFLTAWRQQGQEYFGQVLIERKRRPAYHASVLFLYGPDRRLDGKPPYHGISVYGIDESTCTPESRSELVKLADQLFVDLEMDYGFLCLEDEYELNNIVTNIPHPDGTVEPRMVIGMKWPYCIPGLYWINYFGKRYLEQGFAAERAGSCAENITGVGRGIRVQVSKDPRFFESSQGRARYRELRQSLGERWFFDWVGARECLPLGVSLEELRSPVGTA